jgi:hypothetical protein
MAKYTKKELLAKIAELELDEAVRVEVVSKIQSVEEITPELISWIKEKIQKALDDAFVAIGVNDNENDPEYKKKYEEMMKEIDSAEKDFEGEMEKINKEADQLRDDASQQIDDVQAQAVKDQIKGM